MSDGLQNHFKKEARRLVAENPYPLPGQVPPPEPCDNCGIKPGAVFCCSRCQQLFCVECVTFAPKTDADPSGRVSCWTCDGVGGAAARRRRLQGKGAVHEN